MCGEHERFFTAWGAAKGSSPHVRGARDSSTRFPYPQGIIPACAGSTCRPMLRTLPARDHPRMCGEHRNPASVVAVGTGSSPHVRGAHPHAARNRRGQGIIPACAGSTRTRRQRHRGNGDHPRMCGEHTPQMESYADATGSSPHVRGAPLPDVGHGIQSGIIPACAGSTSLVNCWGGILWDHPRMCGEHDTTISNDGTATGSSPHVRGALVLAHRIDAADGIIPACAGSTAVSFPAPEYAGDHPRMCGEHPTTSGSAGGDSGSSPHVRGARSPRQLKRFSARDHPRMCGEHSEPALSCR